MNEEIEIKVTLNNPQEVEQKLREIATFINEKKQKDEYFIPQHQDFFSVNPVIEYLRVRHQEGKNNLGYHFCHRNQDGSSIKTDEYEAETSNPEMISTILKKLGMTNKVTIIKDRKIFSYKGFEIVIDYVENLGWYLEIEAENVYGSYLETKNKLLKILEELNAEWKEVDKGYPEILLEKHDH